MTAPWSDGELLISGMEKREDGALVTACWRVSQHEWTRAELDDQDQVRRDLGLPE